MHYCCSCCCSCSCFVASTTRLRSLALAATVAPLHSTRLDSTRLAPFWFIIEPTTQLIALTATLCCTLCCKRLFKIIWSPSPVQHINDADSIFICGAAPSRASAPLYSGPCSKFEAIFLIFFFFIICRHLAAALFFSLFSSAQN